ncbi:MAG: hypothetical protein M1836_007295 [Candelina mexicana]|nr:MAG: hypothetical protein M1836_007295 [Candelina mexicana]
MASKAAAPRRAEVNAVSVNGDIPEPASFDGDSHAARLKATEPCMPWQRSSRASKGSGSQRSIAYCTSQSDCCIGYRCAWQKVTQWFILLGKVQPFFDGGVGTCISAVSTELSTVQGREAEVAPSELESQRRIKERRDDNHKIRRTVSRNRLHRRRGKPRKRSYDPFCNEEYGRPDRDDCDRAWHQVPQGPIQRWFFNGNYDALPSFETIRPLEKLPQVWESGTCKIQIKFTVDEDVGSEPDKDPNEEDFDHFVRPPFVYRPFDETTWDEIDNAALDIYSFCVAHPLSGLGGSDMAVSKYKKLEVNMYALDSQYNKDEVATAAAATTAQNPGGAGQQSGTDGGLGKPQNKPPFPSWKSPQTSPYWFMEHCPTGTIYCTKDSDCGEACGPGQSCKILNLLSQVIMTGMQVAKTIAGLGSCHPL